MEVDQGLLLVSLLSVLGSLAQNPEILHLLRLTSAAAEQHCPYLQCLGCQHLGLGHTLQCNLMPCLNSKLSVAQTGGC